MPRSARSDPTQRAQPHQRHGHRPQRGAATAEFAIGVVAAVLVAALLLHLALSGFFDVLLRSLFERGLDLAVDLLATTTSWSLSDISTGTLSGLSAVAKTAGDWARSAVMDTASAVSSGALPVGHAAASGAGSVVESLAHATARALRWAGGPVSSALPW